MIHKIQYVIEKNTLLFAEYARYTTRWIMEC